MPVQPLVNQTYQKLTHDRVGQLTDVDAEKLIKAAESENTADSSSWWCCFVDGIAGTKDLNKVLREHPDRFESRAEQILRNWLSPNMLPVGPTGPTNSVEKILVEIQTKRKTWTCNWFPMGLRANAAGANLYYSASGPSVCEKYDQMSGKKSTAYEKANHAGNRVSWAGHCDMAARVCCLLQAPIRAVTYNGVSFSMNDIQGLLVMVSNDLGKDEPFIGQRNNGNPGEDKNEPYPAELLPKLIELIETGEPWVADIDPGPAVWNYAFDRAKITEYETPPEGLDSKPSTQGGKVKYQKWELSGTGYDEEARHFRSWIEYDSNGKALASDWYLIAADGKDNFDFVWQPRPIGDLTRKSIWPTACTYNPEIDPQVVFEIYQQSI